MVQAVRRALGLLEIVAARPEEPLALGAIARRAGLRPATCAHIVKTLVEAGYLDQPARRGGYVLGPAAYALSARGTYRKDLVQRTGPVMEQLAARLNETVILAVLRADRRLTLHEVGGGGALQIRGDVVRADDPYATATGRLLVAGLGKDELAGLLRISGLPGKRWPEAATRKDLDKELARIRSDGMATVDRGEVVGVAFPIVKGGRTAAALGLFLPAFRFVGAHRREVLAGMRAAVESLSETERESAGTEKPAKEKRS